MEQFKYGLKNESEFNHYYGDRVRILFLIIGTLMIGGLPVFSRLIAMPYILSVLVILLIAIFAGLTNPKIVVTILFDLVVSVLGFIAFEYTAVTSFADQRIVFGLFNQAEALLFFIALYFTTKSIRGFFTP